MATVEDLVKEENRRIRMLRMSSDLLIQLLQAGRVKLSEADRLIDGVRRLAGGLFPGKEHVFDLIYLPRFRRALREGGYNGIRRFKVLRGGRSD